MRRVVMAGLLVAASPAAAAAGSYGEFPAPQDYPFRRSILTRPRVLIRSYEQAFRVRIYTTPPQQPFYNVPPYAVITPY